MVATQGAPIKYLFSEINIKYMSIKNSKTSIFFAKISGKYVSY